MVLKKTIDRFFEAVLLLCSVLLIDGFNLVLYQLHVVLQLPHFAVHLVDE